MKRPPWLRRDLTTCAYYYCLRLSEKEFWEELHRLKVPCGLWPRFVKGERSNATTHFLENAGEYGGLCAIVTLRDAAKHDGIQIASLLVHEAVHIWQAHSRIIGSFNDHGDEEEAYAIQAISQELLYSYKEQIYGK